MRLKLQVLLTMMWAAACCLPAYAQSQLPEKKKAVLAFDIKLGELRKNKLVESLNLDEVGGPLALDQEEFPIKSINRIFGAISAPESVEDFQKIEQEPGGDLPMDFFVRVEFTDEAAAKAVVDKMSEKGQTITRDGKSYLKPPKDEDAPANLIAHLADAKTLEFGTETYVFQSTRRLFTTQLTNTWAKMNNDAVRIAIDLEGAQDLVDQAMALAKQGAPKEAEMYLSLVDDIAGLQLSMDLNSKTLLTFVASGKDKDAATHLKGGLDAVLGLAQFAGKQGVDANLDKDMAAVANAILGSLKSTQQGNDITIAIPKPAGFEDAVGKAVQQLQEAFSGQGEKAPFEFEEN